MLHFLNCLRVNKMLENVNQGLNIFLKPFQKWPLHAMLWSTVVKPISFFQHRLKKPLFTQWEKFQVFELSHIVLYSYQVVKMSGKMYPNNFRILLLTLQFCISLLCGTKANTIFFLKADILYEQCLLKSAHTNHSTSPETTMCDKNRRRKILVVQERRKRIRHKRSSSETVSKVFDLICAHELLIMQPTSWQLHIAGGLHKINFRVIIKNRQRKTWSKWYRSHKHHN